MFLDIQYMYFLFPHAVFLHGLLYYSSLGGSGSLRIPAFHNGGCLLDYVPTVSELLENKV